MKHGLGLGGVVVVVELRVAVEPPTNVVLVVLVVIPRC